MPPPNMAHGTAPQDKFVRGIGKLEDGVKLLLDPVKLLSDDALNFVDKQENEEEVKIHRNFIYDADSVKKYHL